MSRWPFGTRPQPRSRSKRAEYNDLSRLLVKLDRERSSRGHSSTAPVRLVHVLDGGLALVALAILAAIFAHDFHLIR